MPIAASKPIVCYVTDLRSLARGTARDSLDALRERIRAAATAGVDWVQIREKDLPGRELLGLAREAVGMGSARVIVNDRADVALAAGAAGVHLGGESAPLRDVARWLRIGAAPEGFLVGASCHSVDKVRQAEAEGASYAFFGPVFDTPSKRTFGEPQGIARLDAACRAVKIPVIGIGGISEENAADCIRAGAAGIAAIRLFQDAGGAAELARAIERIHAAARA